jgi:hypothetical protein
MMKSITELLVKQKSVIMNRVCIICGKKFYSKRSLKNKWYRCCSKKCADISRRKRVKIKCKRCKEIFEVSASTLKYRKVIFCSRKCRYPIGRIKKKRIYYPYRKNNCIFCGKITHNVKFCSKKCCGKYFKISHLGKNNPCWRGGTSKLPYHYQFNEILKLKIRKKFKYTCQLCLKKVKGKKAHCHHIDRKKENSNEKNLVLLCSNCHGKMSIVKGYNKYKKLFKDIINQ